MNFSRFLFNLAEKSQQRLINSDERNFNIQNYNDIKIRNPIAIIQKPKGCLKTKRTKSTLEESNIKTQYKCKLCKQIGHNSKTYKGKENQEVRRES